MVMLNMEEGIELSGDGDFQVREDGVLLFAG
jgi:hypothetical protein